MNEPESLLSSQLVTIDKPIFMNSPNPYLLDFVYNLNGTVGIAFDTVGHERVDESYFDRRKTFYVVVRSPHPESSSSLFRTFFLFPIFAIIVIIIIILT